MLIISTCLVGAQEPNTVYEVPVSMKQYIDPNKDSMAKAALKETALVEKSGENYTYKLYFQQMDFMGTSGGLTNLFYFDQDGQNKKEAQKTQVQGSHPDLYKIELEDQRDKILVAVWVDAMDAIAGGQPGAGEQKAYIVLDWAQAKEISQGQDQGQAKADTDTSKDIRIEINGQIVESDVAPFIENDRTLVPVRIISESLGYKVDWNSQDKIVTVSDKIQVQIGSNLIENKEDGSQIQIEAPAQIKDDRTFVPIRAIAEILGRQVDWDSDNRIVKIK